MQYVSVYVLVHVQVLKIATLIQKEDLFSGNSEYVATKVGVSWNTTFNNQTTMSMHSRILVTNVDYKITQSSVTKSKC